MKDLGTFHYFLGIEVVYSHKGYLLSQSKYISNILEQAWLSYTFEVNSPFELNVKYVPSDGVTLPYPTLYCTLIDNLTCLTITKLDIAYLVYGVSKFVVSPTIVHGSVVHRILRNLRETQIEILLFPTSSPLELHVYFDVDWDGDSTNSKYVTCFCIFLGDSLIS
ncbi:uncharacterized mitochondrial protein AtMg00810-like [Lathyrus oleraceus]|uniref:uncharacterized mitochondrial protein AtMg00810-like n=1 Tax=Pisum sativum TaxID=3888 RepID=UPI0021D1E735|nr:uncharacterized mitochondrial protein AtMg00810-like [Pisum sativum]